LLEAESETNGLFVVVAAVETAVVVDAAEAVVEVAVVDAADVVVDAVGVVDVDVVVVDAPEVVGVDAPDFAVADAAEVVGVDAPEVTVADATEVVVGASVDDDTIEFLGDSAVSKFLLILSFPTEVLGAREDGITVCGEASRFVLKCSSSSTLCERTGNPTYELSSRIFRLTGLDLAARFPARLSLGDLITGTGSRTVLVISTKF